MTKEEFLTTPREQANKLVKAMISTLAALENNIQLTNDADLKALQECQDIIQRFYNRQDLIKAFKASLKPNDIIVNKNTHQVRVVEIVTEEGISIPTGFIPNEWVPNWVKAPVKRIKNHPTQNTNK